MMTPTVTLGEVCDINPSTEYTFEPDDACTFVPMEAVDDIDARIARASTRPFREVSRGYTAFAENDVIVAKITPCMENGKCAIGRNLGSGVAFGSTEFHVLRATERIIPEWLFYFWRFPPTRTLASLSMTGSAGQKRVPVSFLETARIPLPDLPEQRRISLRLEQADRLCRTSRYALELTDTFLSAAFLQLFGDPHTNSRKLPVKLLGDLCERVTVGFVGPMVNEYVPRGIPLLRSLNVRRNLIDRTDLKFVSAAFHDRLRKSSLSPGDVVSVRTGKPGVTAVIPPTIEDANCADLIVMTCGPSLVPSFLSELLNLLLGDRDQIQGTTGAIQAHFNIERAKQVRVPVPSLVLQQRFVAMVERVERLRAVKREALRQAEHLFASLLQRAFSAESREVMAI